MQKINNISNNETNGQTNVGEQEIFTAINSILAVPSLYFVVVLCIHVANEKRKFGRFMKLSLAKKFSFISKIISLVVAIFSFSLILSTIIDFNFSTIIENYLNEAPKDNETILIAATKGCEALGIIGNLSLTFGIGFVYLFLWLRQRILYIHPSLKSFNKTFIKCISFAIFFVWLAYYFVVITCSFFLVRYKFVKGGCFFGDERSGQSLLRIIYSWMATSVFMQIILLFLFLNPIVKQQGWRRKNNLKDEDLFKRIKKAIALTVISLVVDVIPFILSIIAFNSTLQITDLAQITSYNINLLINTVIVVFYFDNWKKIIWPFQSDDNLDKHVIQTQSNFGTSFIVANTSDTTISPL